MTPGQWFLTTYAIVVVAITVIRIYRSFITFGSKPWDDYTTRMEKANQNQREANEAIFMLLVLMSGVLIVLLTMGGN